MGVDVRIYVAVPPDEPAAFQKSLRRWNYEIGSSFGTTGSNSIVNWPPLTVIERGPEDYVYETQPAPPSGYALLELDTWARYYGIGYERGSWPLLSALMRWISDRIPSAKVYYGGDSGSALLLFDKTMEDELWEHFVENGGRPYFQREERITGLSAPKCPDCDETCSNAGGGRDISFWVCLGCDWRAVSRTDGSPVQVLGRGVDFHERDKVSP